MNELATLTKREAEIAELFAWGAAKKDISNRLFISERTVENHARAIYEKVGCGKVNELSAWWFCTHFNIPFDLSPLKQKVVACMILFAFVQSNILGTNESERYYRRYMKNERTALRRRNENEFDDYSLIT
jgi:DNA-binding CsgD family transcriptional regulator